MLFSQKIIVFLFIALPLNALAQSSPMDSVEKYKDALFKKDIDALYKISSPKHKSFLKKNKIKEILKKNQFPQFEKKKVKIHETQSKVVKGSYQVVLEESKENKEIFQIIKIKDKFFIDKVVNDTGHSHH